MLNRALCILVFVISLVVFTAISSSAATQETLTFMQWSLGESMDAWWLATLEEFGRLNNVKVERVFDTGFNDKLLAMIAGDSAPDVYLVRFDYYNVWAHQGLLYDITSMVDADKSLQVIMLPQDRPRAMVDGRWYGLGFKYAFAHTYYNREFFNQAGIPAMPLSGAKAWSWEQFVASLRKLTRIAADGKVQCWGVSTSLGSWVRNGSLLQSFGVNFVSPEGFDISSPKAVEAVMALRDLYARNLMATYASVANSRNRLPNGQAAIILDLDTDPMSVMTGNGRGYDWFGLGAYPAGVGRSTGTSYMFGENAVVSSHTKNPKLAYAFLRFAIERAWNVRSEVPYLYQGRSGARLHPDERQLAFEYALTNTTFLPSFVGMEFQVDASNAVRAVVEGGKPASYLQEVQRVIDTKFAELRTSIIK